MPKTKKSTKKSKKEVKFPKKKKTAKKILEPSSEKDESLEQAQSPKSKDRKYYGAVGRRKRSVAIVRLFTASPLQSALEGNLTVNDKPYKQFFPVLELQKVVESPLIRLKSLNRFRATIKVRGGGIRGQAEAIRHGLSRTLVLFDSNFRKKLKKAGFLTRDSREKERKKFGLKKARRAPQWTKR